MSSSLDHPQGPNTPRTPAPAADARADGKTATRGHVAESLFLPRMHNQFINTTQAPPPRQNMSSPNGLPTILIQRMPPIFNFDRLICHAHHGPNPHATLLLPALPDCRCRMLSRLCHPRLIIPKALIRPEPQRPPLTPAQTARQPLVATSLSPFSCLICTINLSRLQKHRRPGKACYPPTVSPRF